MNRKWNIAIANTAQMREEVYRLRFNQVGGERWNLESPESGMFRDELDTPAATCLGAYSDSGELIGTMRMVPRLAGPFILDEYYNWLKLTTLSKKSCEETMATTILFDRGVVLTGWRGRGIMPALFFEAARQSLANNYMSVVGAVHQDNNTMLGMCLKMGVQLYQEEKNEFFSGVFFWVSTEDLMIQVSKLLDKDNR